MSNISRKDRNAVVKMLAEGESITTVQSETGLCYADVKSIANEIGWNLQWRKISNCPREAMILGIYEKAAEQFMTLQSIGEIYGISRERVRQILKQIGINVRDIKEMRLLKLSDSIYEIQRHGKLSDRETAEQLDIKPSMLQRAKSKLPCSKYEEIEDARNKQKQVEDDARMKLAREMWLNHEVSDIAKQYSVSVGYMHQMIMRYRARYGWFPFKRGHHDENEVFAEEEAGA